MGFIKDDEDRDIYAECWDNLPESTKIKILKYEEGERSFRGIPLVKVEGDFARRAETPFSGFGEKIQDFLAKEMVKRGGELFLETE